MFARRPSFPDTQISVRHMCQLFALNVEYIIQQVDVYTLTSASDDPRHQGAGSPVQKMQPQDAGSERSLASRTDVSGCVMTCFLLACLPASLLAGTLVCLLEYFPDSQIPRFPDRHMCQLFASQIPRFPDLQTVTCASFLLSRFPDSQIPRFPDSQIPKLACLPSCCNLAHVTTSNKTITCASFLPACL